MFDVTYTQRRFQRTLCGRRNRDRDRQVQRRTLFSPHFTLCCSSLFLSSRFLWLPLVQRMMWRDRRKNREETSARTANTDREKGTNASRQTRKTSREEPVRGEHPLVPMHFPVERRLELHPPSSGVSAPPSHSCLCVDFSIIVAFYPKIFRQNKCPYRPLSIDTRTIPSMVKNSTIRAK